MLDILPPDYRFCPLCGVKLDSRIEEERQRKFCPKCGFKYYPTTGMAAAAVIVKGDKVLMVKRGREPYWGTWMFPAGFLEFGEHPEEAIKREVKEETGLEVKSAKLLDIFQSVDDPRAKGHLVVFYIVEVAGDDLVNGDLNENQDLGWKSIINPPEIGWRSHREIMARLQKGNSSPIV